MSLTGTLADALVRGGYGGLLGRGQAFGNNPERLKFIGKRMVSTHTGLDVMLRGINFGKWLFWQPGDAAIVKAWGVNCIRFPLRWYGQWSEDSIDSRNDADPGHILVASAIQHAAMLMDCISAGMWVVPFIDSQCGQNGLQPDTQLYCDPSGGVTWPDGHNFFRDPALLQLFREVWTFIATMYRYAPRLAMYEPGPELTPQNKTEADVRAHYVDLCGVIRACGGNAPFLVGAKSYSINNIDNAYNAAYDDLAYTGNLFTFTGQTEPLNLQSLTDRMGVMVSMRDTRNVPVFGQQWGSKTSEDPTRVYQHRTQNLFIQNNVPSVYWQLDDGSGSNTGYGVFYTQAGSRVLKTARHADLLQYWAGNTVVE